MHYELRDNRICEIKSFDTGNVLLLLGLRKKKFDGHVVLVKHVNHWTEKLHDEETSK